VTAAGYVALAVLVTVSMAMLDYAHARYWAAMKEFHASDRAWNLRGALWSVVQWGAGAAAFYVNVRVSMWYLPFEGLGLLLGTLLGSRRSREATSTSSDSSR
jgi:hypothetical protein